MDKILEYAKNNFVPIVRPKTLELLLKTIKDNSVTAILEIGTAIGFSGIKMLENSNAKLTTVEKYEKYYLVAKDNFERLGYNDRVCQIFGDARNEMQNLINEGKKFDFIFLDGPKGQYLSYLPMLDKLLIDGGIIFADDVLFRGLVKGNDWPEHRTRTIVINLRKYLQEVNLPPFKSVLYEMEDGVCITTKEKTNDWVISTSW